MHKSVLALDLGTNTGWALRQSSGAICSGTQSFKPGRYDGGGMRYLRFSAWLKEITNGVERLAFEEVRRHAGTDAAHVYGGFLAHLTAFCESANIPYEGVPVGTIKKFGCGKGNGGKEEMIAAAVANGFNPIDDNEADAIHLLRYVESVNDILINEMK